jgi:hypothetical protein
VGTAVARVVDSGWTHGMLTHPESRAVYQTACIHRLLTLRAAYDRSHDYSPTLQMAHSKAGRTFISIRILLRRFFLPPLRHDARSCQSHDGLIRSNTRTQRLLKVPTDRLANLLPHMRHGRPSLPASGSIPSRVVRPAAARLTPGIRPSGPRPANLAPLPSTGSIGFPPRMRNRLQRRPYR